MVINYSPNFRSILKGNRVLIKYTIDDVKYEIEKIKEIENDKIQLMKDVDISQYVF